MGSANLLWLVLLAAVALLAAGYAQARIPRHTAGAPKTNATRIVLAVVGLAVGLLGAGLYAEPVPSVLAFLAGFGLVHVPAAFILFFKGARREGRT